MFLHLTPLRPIREQVNQALVKLDALFRQRYAEDRRGGRPSIAPEKLLRAMVLQHLYSMRSERPLMEQVQYQATRAANCGLWDTSDNRHALVVNVQVTQADGFAEREAAKAMIADALQAAPEGATVTIGADKGYDTQEFIETLQQELKVVPHIAQNTSGRHSAVPDEIANTPAYAVFPAQA